MTVRNSYLLRAYGITEAQYNQILKKQKGSCYVCERTPEELGKNLCVDHNHKTGEIRGLLCLYCNHRLVGRHTDPDLLQKVVDYLRQGTGFIVPKKKPKRKKRAHATKRRGKTKT